MPEIKLIKKVDINKKESYHVTYNDEIVKGTSTRSLEEAAEFYEKQIDNNISSIETTIKEFIY